MKNIKTSKMHDVILRPFWNFAYKKLPMIARVVTKLESL